MGYSVDYFFDFSVTTDLKNSSWRILDLDQPSLGMNREYLVKSINDEDVKVNTDDEPRVTFAFNVNNLLIDTISFLRHLGVYCYVKLSLSFTLIGLWAITPLTLH